jgi:hypothetical protein
VSQISPPVRILLIGAVVFLAAWFTILRPKAEEVPPLTTAAATPIPATTPQTGLGKAVDAAKKAAGQTATENAPATAPATTTTPAPKAEAPAAIAIPADALAKLPKDVASALQARKVLVLAVVGDDATPWSPMADDDRYVRNALRKVNRYKGQVLIKQVPAGKLSTYGSLVNDLDVKQTPSVVVIDRDLKGRVLTGYVDRVSINQVIADARRDSINPNIKGEFERNANAVCAQFDTRAQRWSLPTVRGKRPLTASYKRSLAIARSYRAKIVRLDTPAKYRSLQKQWLKVMGVWERRNVALVKASKTSTKADDHKADLIYPASELAALDRMFEKAGITDCASNRRS